MAVNQAPPPLQDPLIEGPQSPFITKIWARYLQASADRGQATAKKVRQLSFADQSAAIGLTTLVPVPNAGRYRVSWYLRVKVAAGTSSSAQLSVTGTDGAGAVTQQGPACTGNTATTAQSGSLIVRTDAAAPITFSLAYGSVGAPAMKFDLDLVAEEL